MSVLRVTISASIPSKGGSIAYEDLNYASRAGWKEIVIVPHDGAELTGAIERLLGEEALRARLGQLSRELHEARGTERAAGLIERVALEG